MKSYVSYFDTQRKYKIITAYINNKAGGGGGGGGEGWRNHSIKKNTSL